MFAEFLNASVFEIGQPSIFDALFKCLYSGKVFVSLFNEVVDLGACKLASELFASKIEKASVLLVSRIPGENRSNYVRILYGNIFCQQVFPFVGIPMVVLGKNIYLLRRKSPAFEFAFNNLFKVYYLPGDEVM